MLKERCIQCDGSRLSTCKYCSQSWMYNEDNDFNDPNYDYYKR